MPSVSQLETLPAGVRKPVIPDYVSPITGYRVWQCASEGLKSLNGELWPPAQPLVARCRTTAWAKKVSEGQSRHDAPQWQCTCGVYAAKSPHHLRRKGYLDHGICGEVYLWGQVVEHHSGWRAQFGYPKNLVLSADRLPLGLAGVTERLDKLIAYRTDIFLSEPMSNFLLWSPNSGYQADGLEWLLARGRHYYHCRRGERKLKKGDRVAVIGLGIAVVVAADEQRVRAVVGNRSKLCFSCSEIRWNRSNIRWEIPMERVLVAGKEGRLRFVQSGCTTGLGVVQPDCSVRQRLAGDEQYQGHVRLVRPVAEAAVTVERAGSMPTC